ncbi:hypothetical protein J6590_026707 [Homalodisca vitripennis]|nr:hypothetical protein J6590_026707 [Homalodisca vitripennis]
MAIFHQNTDRAIVILTEHGQKKETLENTRLTEYSMKTAFCRENHQKATKTEAVDLKDFCIENWKMLQQKNTTILIGDINIDCLAKRNDHLELTDTLDGFGMYRVELPPTRITPTSQTSIDCVCTNLPTADIKVQVLNTCISNHTGQICEIVSASTEPPSAPITKKRNFSNKNIFKKTLQQENWTDIYNTIDPNNAYAKFNTTI